MIKFFVVTPVWLSLIALSLGIAEKGGLYIGKALVAVFINSFLGWFGAAEMIIRPLGIFEIAIVAFAAILFTLSTWGYIYVMSHEI